jgi:opacity protein-like surface antigen
VQWKSKFKTGYEVNAAIGCKLCSNWRIEGEFLYQNLQRNISGSYTWNEFDAATGIVFANANEPIRHATTRTNIYTLLTNFNYDHRTCSCWIFSIGGGVGVAWLQSKSTSKTDTLVVNLPTHVPPIVESSQTLEKSPKLYGTAFAWQVKVGMGYEFLENFSAEVNYRLFGTTRFQARSSSITTNPGTAVAAAFTIPPDEIRGMLNSSINLSLNLGF